jgi:sterol desaturase/sphingolipid hydroxylase (fatty acid hydroxylase superfamily)
MSGCKSARSEKGDDVSFEGTERLIQQLIGTFLATFFAPGSTFSLASLFSALAIAVAFLLLRRAGRRRSVKIKVMLRALFPRWLYRNNSSKADLFYLFFNMFGFSLLFGWAILSLEFVNRTTTSVLSDLFGVLPKTELSDLSVKSIMTVALFVAYELGYWTYHYLSHRIPVLWEFHKVHHTAEVLSPITIFRMHPVDTLAFEQFLAVCIGVAGGTLSYALGTPTSFFAVNETNLILLIFVFVTVHLQHSHIWIAATGPLGCLLMSPAHHQLHHSNNPLHFNKNLGSCLSLWDWLFGTLQMPARERERITFGTGPRDRLHHTVTGGLLTPFILASQLFAPKPTRTRRRAGTGETA